MSFDIEEAKIAREYADKITKLLNVDKGRDDDDHCAIVMTALTISASIALARYSTSHEQLIAGVHTFFETLMTSAAGEWMTRMERN